MGYDLHITRAEEWLSNDGNQILLQEWLNYVRSDPSLTLRGEKVFPYEALWSGDETCGKSEYPEAWLNWRGGCIYTKSPDRPLIGKMVLIARDLNARVQGDDLEFYLWDQIQFSGSPPTPYE